MSRVLQLTLALSVMSAVSSDASSLTATVVERSGTRHTVDKIEIKGTTTLEYYLNGRRRLLDMARIDRITFGGTPQEQEVPVTITLRSGKVDKGSLIISGGSSPHDDLLAGGSHVGDRLTGNSQLGPLTIPLRDVQDVLFEHSDDVPIIPDAVSGSIVDERGKRFVVSDIRYRGDEAFRFTQGRKKRRVALRHVERLEFGEAPGGEVRPVTITYKTGKIVQGEVDASIVRLPGEVDHVYNTRVDSAFTGVRASGSMYGVGLQHVKLVLIDAPAAEADSTEAADAVPETNDGSHD